MNDNRAHRPKHLRILGAAVVALTLFASGCSGDGPGKSLFGGREPEYFDAPVARAADGDIILQPAADETSLSVALSEVRYESSPGVVVATSGDDPEATDVAAEFGIPLLVLPAEAAPEQVDVIADEVTRLGAGVVTSVGIEELPEAIATAAMPGEGDEGKRLAPAETPSATWTAIVADDATAAVVGPYADRDGAEVLVAAEPRQSGELIATLAADPGTTVIGIGEGLPDEESFAWQVRTARTGVILPGGDNQSATSNRIYVALYGHPGTAALGVLGEQGVEATIARAAEHAYAYAPYTDLNLVPTMEIIATVASASAGADGNYSAESDLEHLRPLINAAGEAGQYVVLDLQPGRTDFLTQAKLYEEFLLMPHVGLALDPEWRLKPDQVHLRQIGSVGADEVNTVITWLADLTRDNDLPQKILILHSFQVRMLPDVGSVDTSRPELALTVHVDGQGGQSAKQDTWRVLHNHASNIPYWGWKNFYDEDSPAMLTPAQTIANVHPTPLFISYQ